MSERHLTITNGRIVRPGFYRSADGSGQEYAKAVSTGMLDQNCVFCPERMKSRGDRVVISMISGSIDLLPSCQVPTLPSDSTRLDLSA